MIQNRSALGFLLVGVVLIGAMPASADDKKIRSGTVVGVLTDKKPTGGGLLIKADGEEASRRYWRFGDRPAVNKQIEAVPAGSRVRVKWEAPGNEGPHIAAIEVLQGPRESIGSDSEIPSLEKTLAWIKRVDGELTKPRYADLTLDRLKTLTELQIGGHRKSDKKHLFVKPEEFRHLVPLTQLKKLHLGENDGVTDESLVFVGKLSGIRELILWDAPITDAGMKHLTSLKELTILDLAFATKLSTASLEYIIQLPRLEHLNLAGTKVDNVSLLREVPTLKELRLGKLKPEGIDRLKKANSTLIIK